MKIELVIFDLDGTLVDSGGDIAWAANKTLSKLGCATMGVEHIKSCIGWGVDSLLERLLTDDGTIGDVAGVLPRAREIFLGFYEARLFVETLPYPGVVDVLKHLKQKNIPMAIVTNKPLYLTGPILDGLDIAHYFQMVVGGDSFENKKPHPEPLLAVLKELEVSPDKALYVGDSTIDCEAGKGAGITTLGAGWGFRGRGELTGWGCGVIMESLVEMLDYLD